jgi:hypothetical protein
MLELKSLAWKKTEELCQVNLLQAGTQKRMHKLMRWGSTKSNITNSGLALPKMEDWADRGESAIESIQWNTFSILQVELISPFLFVFFLCLVPTYSVHQTEENLVSAIYIVYSFELNMNWGH